MNEKREDHPLWPEFAKWFALQDECGTRVSEAFVLLYWPAFLAGAEAAFMKGGPYAAAKRKQTCDADRLTNAAERLEKLDERSEELAVGYNAIADRLSRTAREVDADRQRCEKLISHMELVAQKQEHFGNWQGEVTCQMDEYTTNLYNLVKRQEHATKRLEATAKGLLELKFVVDEKSGS